LVVTTLLSMLAVWLSIRYANHRDLVDRPGPRRSHKQITARGGGIGIVVAVLAMAWFPSTVLPPFDARGSSLSLASAIGFSMVAAIGWIDDHRPLGARVRILVHCAAALLLLLGALLSVTAGANVEAFWKANAFASLLIATVGALLALIAIVWSINLHNFMDGINGLLACQCLFVFCALAALCVPSEADLARLCLVFAAATLGFIPFNFPRARIFMGDVGSGALGFLVAMSTLIALQHSWFLGVCALILSSAFVTDATCTLLSRMLRGRRWYSAHREHLYQWLARSGFSHAGVVGLYMGWNFIVVMPVLYCTQRYAASVTVTPAGAAQSAALIGVVLVYALAGGLWIAGKRWCIRAAKQRYA
jgi:UDP-N-acetylmuramyl pentapeptide phosphotransferase/UDP-N-acetylglucosamine-1-phosphate transferase